MKILVTGGSGFMGSAFIRYILSNNPSYKVINFDKLTYAGNNNNLTESIENPHYAFIEGDITNLESVYQVMNDVDIVVHYAAETPVDRSIENPNSFATTNFIGTLNILEAVKKLKIKRMIQISTDEVYGSRETGTSDELSAYIPNNPYSASKAGADQMCRAYYQTFKLPVIVTHGCNNYGAYQHLEKFIPLCITNLIQEKKIPLYGDGSNIRTWINIKDYCRAIDVILHHGIAGEIYNIGTPYKISNIDLVKMILTIMNKPESYIQFVQDRIGHDFRYSISYQSLTNLGWQPEIGLEQGLRNTIEWYQKNISWWKI